MTIVRAKEGESVDVLIRRFNKKVQLDGVLTELRKREYYEKPSVQRKKAKAVLERKLQKVREEI